MLRRTQRRVFRRCNVGRPRRPRGACSETAAGPHACTGRWEVSSRVSENTGRPREGAALCKTLPYRGAHDTRRHPKPLEQGTGMKTAIKKITGRRIWDSRGRPTVEVDVELTDGAQGRGIAPAGASRGSNEAIDLRDGGSPLAGFGVQRALSNIGKLITPALTGMDAMDPGG